MHLGTLRLDDASLNTRAADLSMLGAAFADDGDLLLYGCNVAAGQAGETFVQRLVVATDTDVAASNDLTGSAAKDATCTIELAA